MRIIFEDDGLRMMAEDASFTSKRWGRDVVKAYRKTIQKLLAATDERDLYALRSLHLERLKGARSGTSSIRVDKQFRLIITFRTEDTCRTVIVIEMVDYH